MARYTGGFIRSTEFTTTRFSTTSGMFTLGQQLGFNATQSWPTEFYDVVLQFTGAGSWECPAGVTEIEYLIVAGGGSGSGGDPSAGASGGGGAGGVRQGSGFPVIAGKTYNIEIGGGGPGVGNSRGSNGESSGFLTEGQSPGYKQYYVSVGDPGAGNKYYIKEEQTDTATGNIAGRTLQLYEGSTYRFDTSHPTTPGHPFHFSESPNGPAVPYSTQSGTQGSPGAYTQLVVPSPGPDLYYYCTVHPGMGGPAETLANASIVCNGGGGSGQAQSNGHQGGSGGGGNLGARELTFTAANGHGASFVPGTRDTAQGFAGGDSNPASPYGKGGGGGAAQEGFGHPAFPTAGGNGGNGIQSSISGTSRYYGGGGGGANYATPLRFGIGGLGGGGNALHSGTPGFNMSIAPLAADHSGEENTGGGGGGGSSPGGISFTGGSGGSGVIFIKYRNKNSNRVFKFTGSGVWKNDFGAKEIEYLIVGGGGGGTSDRAGGAGAGGLLFGTSSINENDTLTISIGGGGTASQSFTAVGGVGSNTTISGALTFDIGGGGGSNKGRGSSSGGAIQGGGSGGARCVASPSPTGEQGNDGGGGTGPIYASGGGGGAGQAGFDANAPENNQGRGGNGVSYNIEGSSKYYAGGGGGSYDLPNGPAAKSGNEFIGGLGGGGGGGGRSPFPGTISEGLVAEGGNANTGGGAGGGQGGGPDVSAKDGGSGVVVIKITG